MGKKQQGKVFVCPFEQSLPKGSQKQWVAFGNDVFFNKGDVPTCHVKGWKFADIQFT